MNKKKVKQGYLRSELGVIPLICSSHWIVGLSLAHIVLYQRYQKWKSTTAMSKPKCVSLIVKETYIEHDQAQLKLQVKEHTQ